MCLRDIKYQYIYTIKFVYHIACFLDQRNLYEIHVILMCNIQYQLWYFFPQLLLA